MVENESVGNKKIESSLGSEINGETARQDVSATSDRRCGTAIRWVGIMLLAAGLVGMLYGPYEIYCFYLFSPGGRFHYAGFGVGSFWFACLVAQNIIYYVVAAVLIPIGVGFIELRVWSRQIALTVLYSWLALGSAVFCCYAFSFGALAAYYGVSSILAAGAAILVLAIALPVFLVRALDGARLTSVLCRGESPRFLDRIPRPVQVTVVINAAFVVFLHVEIFFKGIFPVFGRFIFLRNGIIVISAAILVLSVLTYGYALGRRWGFWGLLSLYAVLTASFIATFSRYSAAGILGLLEYTSYELREARPVISLARNINFGALAASLLLVALAVLLLGRIVAPRPPRPVTNTIPGISLQKMGRQITTIASPCSDNGTLRAGTREGGCPHEC